jgi:hypothetical protein
MARHLPKRGIGPKEGNALVKRAENGLKIWVDF